MCKLKLRVKCLDYQSLRNRFLINMEVLHVIQNLILPKSVKTVKIRQGHGSCLMIGMQITNTQLKSLL